VTGVMLCGDEKNNALYKRAKARILVYCRAQNSMLNTNEILSCAIKKHNSPQKPKKQRRGSRWNEWRNWRDSVQQAKVVGLGRGCEYAPA
jgi:hypothetical protein